jgi:hypothetical protein
MTPSYNELYTLSCISAVNIEVCLCVAFHSFLDSRTKDVHFRSISWFWHKHSMRAVVCRYTAIVHLYIRTRTYQQTTQKSTNVSYRMRNNFLILQNPKTHHFGSNSQLSEPSLKKFNKDTIITPYLPILWPWAPTHAHKHTCTSCMDMHHIWGLLIN